MVWWQWGSFMKRENEYKAKDRMTEMIKKNKKDSTNESVNANTGGSWSRFLFEKRKI